MPPKPATPGTSPALPRSGSETTTQQRLHIGPNRTQHLVYEPCTAVRPITHLRPILEQHAGQRQQILADSPTHAPTLAQGPEIADQVRPTQLPPAIGQDLVDLPTVADNDASDNLAQQGLQAGQTTAGMDHEGCHRGRGRQPQPTLLAGLAPTGLVSVFDLGSADGGHCLGMGRGQRLAHLFFQMADAAQRQGHVEDCLGDLLDTATADAMAANQVGQRGGQIRTEAVSAQVGGYGGMGNGLADGTSACVSLVFGDVRDQGR